MAAAPKLTDPATLSAKVNGLIDTFLQEKATQEPKRDYLGASQLGASCSRAVQYGYQHVPPDTPLSGKTHRIFEIGHALEAMAVTWLRGAGFEIVTRQPNGLPFGFSAAEGTLRGHVDGIIQKAPPEVEIACPALWECKTMNTKTWAQTVSKGLKTAKPAYATQIALYQAYMEGSISGVSQNPALLTAINKDTADLYHELIPFDAPLAQKASDRAVTILKATQAQEILPRISTDSQYFECRFCNWSDRCWRENS